MARQSTVLRKLGWVSVAVIAWASLVQPGPGGPLVGLVLGALLAGYLKYTDQRGNQS